MDTAKVINELKAVCQRSLLTLLDDMFASCDDLYFDLASRAESNTEQNVYFESMREVRVHTKPTIDAYTRKLALLFSTVPEGDAVKPPDLESPHEFGDGLSLLGDEELESDVALTNMSTRARTLSSSELYQLEQRLSTIYQREIDENNNPLDPQQLCELFADATQTMSLNIKARIILYKQYERYVVNRLPEIYSQASTVLNNAGIEVVKGRRTRRRDDKQSETGDQPANTPNKAADGSTSAPVYRYGAPAFNELTQLIDGLRTLSTSGQNASLPLFSSGSGPSIDQRELLELIAQTQSMYAQPGQQLDIRSYLQQTLAHDMPSGKARSVDNVDEDVINLVAMFFDFILDDRNIPVQLQALISRLQIPILKIALKDRGFFSNSDHPARAFINEVARIGIGIENKDDTQSKALIEKLESMVQHIHDHHADNEKIFVDMLDELEEFTQKLDKRASLVEKRTSETAEGQAKTQMARLEVQRAIQDSMEGRELPEAISHFIAEQWQDVLFSTIVKHGDESELWQDHLQTMQDLIWSSQKHSDEKSISRFEALKHGLYQKLQGGLASTNASSEQSEAAIKAIIQVHHDLNDSDASDVVMETFKSEESESMEALKQQKTWKEMTALERQKVKYQALEYEFIKKAEALNVGDWLEFKQMSSGTVTRCKLAAKLDASDSYIFVNRLGFKVLEKARKEVAYDMQRDRARVLETGPAFERSLHRMVTNLKNITSQVRR